LTSAARTRTGQSIGSCRYARKGRTARPDQEPDGTVALFDSDRPGGYGGKDLWWIHTTELIRSP
jgi:hypothetical protein